MDKRHPRRGGKRKKPSQDPRSCPKIAKRKERQINHPETPALSELVTREYWRTSCFCCCKKYQGTIF
jgi:hypothetical protein